MLYRCIILTTLGSLWGGDLFGVVAPQVKKRVHLTLKKSIVLTKPQVLLSEITDCKSHFGLCEEIHAIEVVRNTNKEQEIFIDAKQIKALIDEEWQNVVPEVVGKKIKINFRYKKVDVGSHSDLIRAHIDRSLTADGRRFASENFRIMGENDFYYGDKLIGIECPSLKKQVFKHKGFSSRRVRTFCQLEGVYDQYPVEMTVKIYELGKVYFLVNPIHLGEKIEPKNLQLVWKKMGSQYLSHVTNIENIEGYMAKRRLMPGDILKWSHLKKPHMVKNGEEVIAILKNKGLTLKMKAKVLQKGNKGEIVSIKVLKTKKIVKARVIGDKRLIIQL